MDPGGIEMSPRADLLLASASPRRRELLERVGLSLRVSAPDIDESPHEGEAAGDYVRRMAAGKLAAARAVAGPSPVAVLAADTIVILQGRILGKPRDRDDAADMLRRLAGHRH